MSHLKTKVIIARLKILKLVIKNTYLQCGCIFVSGHNSGQRSVCGSHQIIKNKKQ